MAANEAAAETAPAPASQYGVDPAVHEFIQPEKKVKTQEDMVKWESSEAYKDMLGFIGAMNDAVKGKKISDDYPVSQLVTNLVSILDQLDHWIDDIPPIEQPQRFGNTAFRDWFQKLEENAESMLREALEEKFHPAIHEISLYLIQSVGNSIRIDYGTGHELSFASFLCCLYKIGALTESDAVAVVLRAFERYMNLIRRLQTVYRMEPAGSHGVWSLDDHQFIPFIWGSSQLTDHPRIQPKSFVNPDIYQHFCKEYIFLSCIKYICEVKTGPFPEHSNQLWNISGVLKWTKVNSGLIKMYKAEVLARFPVIQHVYFGSLLTINPAS